MDEPIVAPLFPIADAVDGRVQRFVGRVVAGDGDLLTAPLTGRTCVAYDTALWSYDPELGFGGFTRVKKLAMRVLRAIPFVIEDHTGRAYVDPRGCFVRLTLDVQRGGPGPNRQIEVADPTAWGDVLFFDHKELAEGVLAIGEEVVVAGLVHRAANDAPYRASGDPRIRITGSANTPADITDRREDVTRAGGARLPRERVKTPPDGVRTLFSDE